MRIFGIKSIVLQNGLSALKVLKAKLTRQKSTAGFALIEALIATAMTAIALIILIQLSIDSLRRFQSARTQLYAQFEAQSVLKRIGSDIPFALGQKNVDLPRSPYQADISIQNFNFQSLGLQNAGNLPTTGAVNGQNTPQLYQITVTISTTDGNILTQIQAIKTNANRL